MTEASNVQDREFSSELLEFVMQRIKKTILSNGLISKANFVIPSCPESAKQVNHWNYSGVQKQSSDDLDVALEAVKTKLEELMRAASTKQESNVQINGLNNVVLNDWISLQIFPAEGARQDDLVSLRANYCSASQWMLSNLLCSASKHVHQQPVETEVAPA